MADVTQHVVVDLSAVESGSVTEVDAEAVPEEAEKKCGQENDPEADEATGEVIDPEPLIAFDSAEDGATDEESTEHEEDDDRRMACAGEEIRQRKNRAVGVEAGVVKKEEIAAVFEQNQKSRNAAQKIEENRRRGINEAHRRWRQIGFSHWIAGSGCAHSTQ
jgi:hypothetical protein